MIANAKKWTENPEKNNEKKTGPRELRQIEKVVKCNPFVTSYKIK